MIVAIPAIWPDGAAIAKGLGKVMDVILHIGAHRCATTSFQNYLRRNSDRLADQGVGFWGPWRTRSGLFRGILPGPLIATGRDPRCRGIGRVKLQLAHSAGLGVRTLLVSDENMPGTMRDNLRVGELYSGVGERLARYGEAFDGRIRHVVLNVRSQDSYWASVLGYGLARGRALPGPALLKRLAVGTRSWRDMLTDVACALPDAKLWVLPFETFAGRPEAQLTAITRIKAPSAHAREWLNATPRLPQLRTRIDDLNQDWTLPEGDGRWQPFSARQIGEMRESYADDLMWLAGGGDGFARLMPDADKQIKPDRIQAGTNPPMTDMTRGRTHDHQERRVAHAR
jgi:hypothetical protein